QSFGNIALDGAGGLDGLIDVGHFVCRSIRNHFFNNQWRRVVRLTSDIVLLAHRSQFRLRVLPRPEKHKADDGSRYQGEYQKEYCFFHGITLLSCSLVCSRITLSFSCVFFSVSTLPNAKSINRCLISFNSAACEAIVSRSFF